MNINVRNLLIVFAVFILFAWLENIETFKTNFEDLERQIKDVPEHNKIITVSNLNEYYKDILKPKQIINFDTKLFLL